MLDKAVQTNDRKSVGRIIFLLPIVSAKKPHKCELVITPTKAIVLKTPFSVVVKFSSHATGKTKLIPIVSNRTDDKIVPDITISM